MDFDIVKSMIGFYKSGDLKVENTFSIAILDTGIYPHKDLIYPQNRIIYSVDLVNNRLDTYDDNGHGTAMLGIIGANNENGNNGIVYILIGNEEGYEKNKYCNFSICGNFIAYCLL
ncbi:S8 family serine peptidase [Candidatus Galacturonibacter soehngenii]|uniref:Peptidase S8/S53 domain-containing protein n=1 Tax=Candidatus Galacturonatibacter soehngenii TaxID=2307010 RepID=A0A7V7QKN5_9FIRM|nr:S8 family serine peptidase [Candidatus Galacturonibacter soehngenii]KAB1438103.1 hypothetical protein F7O84_11120 [Candidatus Galacturonibacter soehngenii]